MNKKDELDIINRVYDDNFKKIEFEQPDFIVTKCDSDRTFGVEVTQIYRHSSHATLRNSGTYLPQLMNGQYRNKSDEKYLDVGEITLESLDGSQVYNFNAVTTKAPTPVEYVKLLSKTIENKNKKLLKYDETLEYINLIILDNDNGLSRYGKLDIMNEIITDELIKVILGSKYSEVFVTSDGNDEVITYPIKYMSINKMIIQLFMQYKKFCKGDNLEAILFTNFYFNNHFFAESVVIKSEGNYGLLFNDVVYQLFPIPDMKRKNELVDIEFINYDGFNKKFEKDITNFGNEFSKRMIVAGDSKLYYAL